VSSDHDGAPAGWAHAQGSIARIVVRPLGSPLPLGFFAFSLGTLLFSAFELGWVPQVERHSVALMLLGAIFPTQATAAVFCFLTRDTSGASMLGSLSASWLGLGLVLLTQPQAASHHTIGVYILGLSGVLAIFAVLALSGRALFALALLVATPRYLLLGLFELNGSTGLEHASGIAGLVLVAVAVYTAIALMLEDAQQRTVLPLLRRGIARQAVEGTLDEQLERLAREPGVRSQL
jgi:uncharacterized protein